jgi:hypothetical protein
VHRHDGPELPVVRFRIDVEFHEAVQHLVPLVDGPQDFRPFVQSELIVDGDPYDFGLSGGCMMSGIIGYVLAQTRDFFDRQCISRLAGDEMIGTDAASE